MDRREQTKKARDDWIPIGMIQSGQVILLIQQNQIINNRLIFHLKPTFLMLKWYF